MRLGIDLEVRVSVKLFDMPQEQNLLEYETPGKRKPLALIFVAIAGSIAISLGVGLFFFSVPSVSSAPKPLPAPASVPTARSPVPK